LKCVCDTFKLTGAELASDLEWSRNLRAQGFQPRPESTLGRAALPLYNKMPVGKSKALKKKFVFVFRFWFFDVVWIFDLKTKPLTGRSSGGGD
jgi:hypothetical protein